MSRYPIEALLRPPVELYSAAVATASAGLCLAAPWALFMTPGVGYGAATLFAALAAWRGHEGLRVVRYQRRMRRLPRYRLPATRIPWSPTKLFLGRGFRWRQKHTQRLHDTLAPEAAPYLAEPALTAWIRRWEPAWERAWWGRPLHRLTSAECWWNPVRPPPPVGGSPYLHAVEPQEIDIWMPLAERNGHTLVLGTTRVGKTRLAEILVTQDIRRGDAVIVFDPKGDAELMRRVYAEAKRSGRPLYLFHLGHPELSARYNAIGNFSRVTEVATRIANQLPSEGNSAAFKEFAWRFVNIIARALVDLGRRPDYHQIRRHINDVEPLFIEYVQYRLARASERDEAPADWAAHVAAIEGSLNEGKLPLNLKGRGLRAVALYQYLQRNPLYDPVIEGLLGAFKYDRTYYDKIVSSVGPLMEKLTTGKVAELISPDYLDPDDHRPIFDWRSVIRTRSVVYVGLDALSDTTVSTAVGNSMFADLVSVAGDLYKHGIDGGLPPVATPQAPPRICLHADEFNELIGDEFIPMVNKAGGAGFQVTAYTQTWSDVEARVGSRAKAGQVAGNFNTLIMLRVKELATACMLTDQLPSVNVHALTQVSGVSDSSTPGSGVDFTSRNEDRITVSEVPLLTPNDIMSLPKGQAFALIEGACLWKLRMPLPDASNDPHMPPDLQALGEEMARRYRTSDDWYQDPDGEAMLRLNQAEGAR
ncbi:MAG TPA: type IV conjugative transfer system coupling protein TraD [Thiohalobacter sp.]|nr:type IV conjugative transfer system coupling protein TraD [Thiohalobacter sp.]